MSSTLSSLYFHVRHSISGFLYLTFKELCAIEAIMKQDDVSKGHRARSHYYIAQWTL